MEVYNRKQHEINKHHNNEVDWYKRKVFNLESKVENLQTALIMVGVFAALLLTAYIYEILN